jgi:hypothetical protein
LVIAQIAKTRVDAVGTGALQALELEVRVDAEQALDVTTELAQRRQAERRLNANPRRVPSGVRRHLTHRG